MFTNLEITCLRISLCLRMFTNYGITPYLAQKGLKVKCAPQMRALNARQNLELISSQGKK